MKFANMNELELFGKLYDIIGHPDMPKVVFKLLWDSVQTREDIFAYVKNLSADGSYYWVYVNVTTSRDSNNTIGYYSIRCKPNENVISRIEDPYLALLEKEQNAGVNAAMEITADSF